MLTPDDADDIRVEFSAGVGAGANVLVFSRFGKAYPLQPTHLPRVEWRLPSAALPTITLPARSVGTTTSAAIAVMSADSEAAA